MAEQQQQLFKATQFSIYLHSKFSKIPLNILGPLGTLTGLPGRFSGCGVYFFHKATVWADVSVSHQFETGGKIGILAGNVAVRDREEKWRTDGEHDGRGYRLLHVLVKVKIGETKVHEVLDPRNSCQNKIFFQFLVQQLRFSLLITCKHDL